MLRNFKKLNKIKYKKNNNRSMIIRRCYLRKMLRNILKINAHKSKVHIKKNLQLWKIYKNIKNKN